MKLRIDKLKSQVVDRGLCIGCGFCTIANARRNSELVKMEFDEEQDHFVPVVKLDADRVESIEVVCPGGQMDMNELSNIVYGRQPEDPWVGEHLSISAAYSTDGEIRKRSASGGVTTSILGHLFDSGQIDAAYAVVAKGHPYSRAGALILDKRDLLKVHGSVYQPASFGEGLKRLVEGTERFAFVGLPCEIAALELLKKTDHHLKSRHILSIGLFCGGINRFEGINYYLSRFGQNLRNARDIDFRYGNWPGKIRLEKNNGEAVEIARIRSNSRWNILRYVVGFQGYWMLPRCRMCPDQISDFADISVGDPHLPRFRNRGGEGFSAVVTRSSRGNAVFRDAIEKGYISDEPLTREELIESQGYTLDNRRHALAYVRVAGILGMAAPKISVYPAFISGIRFSHFRYAIVDLWKIRLRKLAILKPLYVAIQVFEYLFITFAPRVIFSRLKKLLYNT